MAGFAGTSQKLLGAAALALLVGACSSTPDWANPMEWYRDASDAVFGNGDEAAANSDPDAPKETPGKDEEFPKLSSVPERPQTESAEQRAEIERALVADRENAKYSEEEIQRQTDTGGSSQPAPAATDSASSSSRSSAPAPAPAPATPPAPAPAQSRSAPAQTAAAPTLPPPPVSTAAPSAIGPNPVSQPPRFASPPTSPPPVLPIRPSSQRPSPSSVSVARVGNPTFGAPPSDIAATLGGGGAPQPSFGAPAPQAFGAAAPSPSVAGERAAIIQFKGGSSRLNSADRNRIRKVAQLYRQRGGAVRVEGHASSRTRDMDPVRHQMVNFDVSLDRANAVARELIRAGVPTDAVFVVAMSDTRPIFYEVMPAGDAGNQRVEIYFVN